MDATALEVHNTLVESNIGRLPKIRDLIRGADIIATKQVVIFDFAPGTDVSDACWLMYHATTLLKRSVCSSFNSVVITLTERRV